MTPRSKRLTIFEGPDGAGKTTAAKKYAAETDARYVHFPAMPDVTTGLARMYVEAMLPALLGYQDVVFDRSWLSEEPYGIAFREGYNRVGGPIERMLERLAMRCGAVVIRCDPGWVQVVQSYRQRKALEMLDNENQLRTVYSVYQSENFTQLPLIEHDYTEMDFNHIAAIRLEKARMPCHPLNIASAGNLEAPYVLVGESFAERKDQDPFYQWPFASFSRQGFSRQGCSTWLTAQLANHGIDERDLLWVNADQDLSFLYNRNPKRVIALGQKAAAELYKLKILASSVPHPQYHKSFAGAEKYPLLELLAGEI